MSSSTSIGLQTSPTLAFHVLALSKNETAYYAAEVEPGKKEIFLKYKKQNQSNPDINNYSATSTSSTPALKSWALA